MQCRLPRMQTMISTFDVALSGAFHSSSCYVTIDGTQYTSAKTVTVAKGTSVTVYCYGSSAYINLNGTTVAQASSSAGVEYTFAVTDNCTIVLSQVPFSHYYADITMPA